MFAGLDYGTSNSAIGVINNNNPQLLSLQTESCFLPSTLYTLDRSFICEFLAKNLPEKTRTEYIKLRQQQLQKALSTRRLLDIAPNETTHFFGQQAIDEYIAFPEDGLFIKSPKSFLGSTGLAPNQLAFFEDLVTAMLLHIKLTAETQLQHAIDKVVIGRPINFQGVNSEKSNKQAIDIMTLAASRCGYQAIEFLYEPLAAGVDFESGLQQDKIVLVVDIGGGTTDCSIVKMGPSFIHNTQREKDFLAHSGSRVGGNDLDIALAFAHFMPLFGLGEMQNNQIELPIAPFWSAVSINNVGEQSRFSSDEFARELVVLKRNAVLPARVDRLIHMQKNKLNHRLVRSAELTKIALSDKPSLEVNLDYIEKNLVTHVDTSAFEVAIKRPIQQIQSLISEAVTQAQTQPDIIYITGGSAKSPTIQKIVNQALPGIPVLDGDYYGSVAAGLTKWAERIWQ
ncbi:molecular chaperone [Aliikangiella maris]|uniref:Molecular chaperone n=2 Tax=Aliikangiella maris TaxID=3162458 RepID=A0ABV3MQ12_9GAMM